jgi:dephospho-CoA kinase
LSLSPAASPKAKAPSCDGLQSGERTAISLDQIARALSRPQEALWQAIVAEFGQEYLLPDGELNRKQLGEAIFVNHALRRRLNRISHPLILQRMHLEIQNIQRQEPDAMVVVEVPLLIECALYRDFDRIVVVEAGEAVSTSLACWRADWTKRMSRNALLLSFLPASRGFLPTGSSGIVSSWKKLVNRVGASGRNCSRKLRNSGVTVVRGC